MELTKPEKFKRRFFGGNGFKFMVVRSNKNTVKFGSSSDTNGVANYAAAAPLAYSALFPVI